VREEPPSRPGCAQLRTGAGTHNHRREFCARRSLRLPSRHNTLWLWVPDLHSLPRRVRRVARLSGTTAVAFLIRISNSKRVSDRSLAARCARVLHRRGPSEDGEGAGKAGCWLHPWPAFIKKSTRRLPQVQPEQPGLPCAMVLRLIPRSPREPGFLAPVANRSFCSLGTSVGVPGPHGFAVRACVSRPRKNRALTQTRPSHPASRS
jgi:hypothetical protein